MNNKDLVFGLRSLEADAAIEAMERRERGLPQHPESPLSEKELAELAALGDELGPEFMQQQTDLLLQAVQKGAAADKAPHAATALAAPVVNGVRSDAKAGAQVVPLRPRPEGRSARSGAIRKVFYVVAPLAAAAGIALLLFPVGRTENGFGEPELAVNQNRATAQAGAGPLRFSVDECINIRVPQQKSTAGLSQNAVANAYLVKQGRPPLRWSIDLQPDASGAFSTGACQSLPKDAGEGPQELVVLIGEAGRLLLYRSAAVQTAAGECGSKYGIQCVRRSLFIGPSSGPAN